MGDLRIDNIQHTVVNPNKTANQKGTAEFGEVIKGAINRVNGLEKEADKSIVDLLQGKADIHETMIALQKADVSMRLFLAIRNKVIDAYREIMRMPF